MFSFFNYDSNLIQTLNKVADCICLSFLFLISCIPIVTIGAATTALYYSTNKCIRHGEGHIWHEYWRAFGANFKQATVLWLLLMLVYGLLGGSCYSSYLMCTSGMLPKEMFYFLVIVIAIVIAWANLIFPYLAKFQNTNKMILKNCLGIALMNLPTVLLMFALFILSIVAISMFPLVILCAPGVYMVLTCYRLETVFMKYMTPEDRAREEERLEEAE